MTETFTTYLIVDKIPKLVVQRMSLSSSSGSVMTLMHSFISSEKHEVGRNKIIKPFDKQCDRKLGRIKSGPKSSHSSFYVPKVRFFNISLKINKHFVYFYKKICHPDL